MKSWIGIVLFLFCGAVHAQFQGNLPHTMPAEVHYNAERAGNQLVVGYDELDGNIFGLNYRREAVPVHRKYADVGGSKIVYALMTLDTLVKPDFSYAVSFHDVNDLVLDSVDIWLGHVNRSGANDTLILSLVALDSNHFPGGPLLMADTIIWSTSQSPGDSITNTFPFTWRPDYFMDNTPVGLKIEFMGSILDSMTLVYGHGFQNTPNTCFSLGMDWVIRSFTYPNSYAYWNNFHLILPTSVGGDWFFDCNQNGEYDSEDAENPFQNWAITSYVSAPFIGLNEEKPVDLTIYPNPANNIVNVKGVDMQRVILYSTAGESIRAWSTQNTLDIKGIMPGLYILEMHYENTIARRKILICE